MPRFRPNVVTLFVGTIASLSLIAVASPATADDTAATTDASAEQQLAQTYAPVISLVEQTEDCGPGEPYVPSDVDVMFDNPSVALRGPWTQRDLVQVAPGVEDVAAGLPGYSLDLPGSPLSPGCEYEKWANSVWGKQPTPTVYGRVSSELGQEGRLALQYYFFYPFNDYNNKHEADWERIQLEFAADTAQEALGQTPVRAVYSQHYGAEYATWREEPDSKLEIMDGTHPVVYVSAGSHANQFSSGVFMGNNANLGFGCDTTAGDQRRLEPAVQTIPQDRVAATEQFPWTAFRGHWGEVGPVRFYEAPTGPNLKQMWNKPFTWADQARASSFEVPGSGRIGTRVTDTYCGVVGQGSDLFRRYMSSPFNTLVLLGALLAALGWGIRRTRWQTTTMPLVEHRSAGQVVAASWRLFGTNTGLFLQISAPMVAVTLVALGARALGFVGGWPWWWQTLVVGAGLVSLLAAAAATVHAIGALSAGDRIGPLEAYRGSWRAAASAALPLTVAGVVIVLCLSSLVLTPLAVALLAGWALLVPTIVLDRMGGFRAWGSSLTLAARAWRTVVPVTLLGLVSITSAGFILAAALFVVYPAPFVLLNAVPPLVVALAWPLVMIAATYCHGSARAATQVRPHREGVDA